MVALKHLKRAIDRRQVRLDTHPYSFGVNWVSVSEANDAIERRHTRCRAFVRNLEVNQVIACAHILCSDRFEDGVSTAGNPATTEPAFEVAFETSHHVEVDATSGVNQSANGSSRLPKTRRRRMMDRVDGSARSFALKKAVQRLELGLGQIQGTTVVGVVVDDLEDMIIQCT